MSWLHLDNPDKRRGLRSIVQAVLALCMIGLLYWLTHLLSTNVPGLITIARGALFVLGIGTLFYGAENVSRAIDITTPFGSAKFGEQQQAKLQGAKEAAGAAQDKVQDIAEETP